MKLLPTIYILYNETKTTIKLDNFYNFIVDIYQ